MGGILVRSGCTWYGRLHSESSESRVSCAFERAITVHRECIGAWVQFE